MGRHRTSRHRRTRQHTTTMGRRKIDIAYLTDDRVRKVTFCKRKGGLFKKADDLSKLCGVEVAVVIIGDKKTCEYASTDMNRILERYQTMQAGVVRATHRRSRDCGRNSRHSDERW